MKLTLSKLLLILFAFAFTIGHAQNLKRKIPYYPNEYIKYELRLGKLLLGEAEIIFKTDSVNCGTFIKASARSVGFAKFIKDIEYTFFTCADPKTTLPQQAGRIIREPELEDYNLVEYFRDLRQDSTVIYSKNTDTVVVPKGIFDILTGFYFFRANYLDDDMSDYKTKKITTFFIDEVWDLVLRYKGTTVIPSILGDKRCYIIMPVTKICYFFKTHDDMTLWFTTDNYVPIKIDVRMKIGTLHATMVEYRPPQNKKQ